MAPASILLRRTPKYISWIFKNNFYPISLAESVTNYL